ncbi:MAG: hypothetical protein II824_02705 [Bacteroidales bacterium]|nr:hypothetical protein [Bacteroidales bacterium]
MKGWKVIRNTLLALAGLVLVLLVALQILLRPSVLTGIVNRVTAGMVEGDISFREVRAHVIKSFPFLNIDARDFCITYPHQRYARYDSLLTEPGRRMNLGRMGYGKDGAPDTLASARELNLSLNYVALLQGKYHIHRARLSRPRIFGHRFPEGRANWEILPIGPSEPKADRTGSSRARSIRIDKVQLEDRPLLIFTSPADTLHALMAMRRLHFEGSLDTQDLFQSDASLSLDSMLLTGRLPQDTLALRLESLRMKNHRRHLQASASASTRLRTGSFGRLQLPIGLEVDARFPEREDEALEVTLNRLMLKLSALELNAQGSLLSLADSWDLDVQAAIDQCPVGDLIKEYRKNFDFLKKLDTDARVSLDAAAKGRFGKGELPSMRARLLVPPATVDYEGMGRSGLVAVDVSAQTDDLKEVDARVDRLRLEMAGARIDVKGSARDVLGKDPLIALSGRVAARLDSLVQVFLPEQGISATGSLEMDLQGNSRLSHLSASRIGKARIEGNLSGKDISVLYPKDSIDAFLPSLQLNVSTRGNIIGLNALIDTLDVTYQNMFIRGGGVHVNGEAKDKSLAGSLSLAALDLRDSEGLSVSLSDNTEHFRLDPAGTVLPVPRLNLNSRSRGLEIGLGEDNYSLENLAFDATARRHQRRARTGLPRRDSLARRARLEQLAKDEFASADIRISLSDALKKYFREWDVEGTVALEKARIGMPSMPLETSLSAFSGDFDNDTLAVSSLSLHAGESYLSARARLTGLRRAILGRSRSPLKLKASLRSDRLDVNQLLGVLDRPREVTASASEKTDTSAARSKLLVLPANLEVDFSFEANEILYRELEISWASAEAAMRDRTLQITNALAASNMGDVYVEGFYSTRSKEDLRAGFNLNLVDITAEKIISLMPAVDTLLPMLKSFSGDLDCELAVTSAIDTSMNLILPSMDGVLRISGKDLMLNGSHELSRLTGMLMFKNKNNIHIDKMSVSGILQDAILEVFPFVLDVDRYQLAASGWQHLENEFRYHISVLKSPLLTKFGVNAWGPDFDHIRYGLGKAKYRNANVPVYTTQLDAAQYNLVAAIHNIFDVGIEKAMAQNRDAAAQISASAGKLDAEEAAGDENVLSKAQGLEALVEEVSLTVASRRENLKQEVVREQEKAAGHE